MRNLLLTLVIIAITLVSVACSGNSPIVEQPTMPNPPNANNPIDDPPENSNEPHIVTSTMMTIMPDQPEINNPPSEINDDPAMSNSSISETTTLIIRRNGGSARFSFRKNDQHLGYLGVEGCLEMCPMATYSFKTNHDIIELDSRAKYIESVGVQYTTNGKSEWTFAGWRIDKGKIDLLDGWDNLTNPRIRFTSQSDIVEIMATYDPATYATIRYTTPKPLSAGLFSSGDCTLPTSCRIIIDIDKGTVFPLAVAFSSEAGTSAETSVYGLSSIILPPAPVSAFPAPSSYEVSWSSSTSIIPTEITPRQFFEFFDNSETALSLSGYGINGLLQIPNIKYYRFEPTSTGEHALTASITLVDDISKSTPPLSGNSAFENRIAFTSHNSDGSLALYTIAADGTDKRQIGVINTTYDEDVLAFQVGGSTQISWSPDGKQIAFISTRLGKQIVGLPSIPEGPSYARYAEHFEVSTIATNGTAPPQQLTNGGEHPNDHNVLANWSPNSAQIVYVGRDPNQGGNEIFVMDADGSNARQLTEFGFDYNSNAEYPVWSPDGTRIAFVHCSCSTYDILLGGGNPSAIYTIAPDGSDMQKLIEFDGDIGPVYWSPDSTNLIVSSSAGIFEILANGSSNSPKLLIENNEQDGFVSGIASWSPDGTRIAFSRLDLEDYTFSTYTAAADGSDIRLVSANLSVFYSRVSWSPDSTAVVFSATQGLDGSSIGIYTAPADGLEQPSLLAYTSFAFRQNGGMPVWSPIPAP